MYTSLLARPDRIKERLYLTDREREILTWCANGKSSWDTAMILGITEDGVNFHLKNIFRKLGTQNRMGAIVKALHKGLINL